MTVHKPNTREYLSYLTQGLVTSVILTFFFETLARDLVNEYFSTQMAGFVLVVVLAPIIEEYFKVYPLRNRHPETARSLIKLGYITGLGFGISEFIIYVYLANVPALIRLPGLFFHAASASITTTGITKNRFTQYYLVAVILHAINNFFAELGEIWLIGGLATMFLTYIIAYREYITAEDEYTINP